MTVVNIKDDKLLNVGWIVALSFVSFLFLAIIFIPIDCRGIEKICHFLGTEDKGEVIRLLGLAVAGAFAVLAILAAFRRADAMNRTVDATETGHRQERFRDAVGHLGHDQASVRQGGAHALFHLALQAEELRASIAEILCAHIRETTGKKEYQDEFKSASSTEIQSLLKMLFTTTIRSGTELDAFWKGLKPDLSKGYFCGAELFNARFQSADFQHAQFQGAYLRGAQFQGAKLLDTQFQGANLWGAQFQETCLWGVQLQRATLWNAQFQRAALWNARFQGANLWEAQFQDAFLKSAKFQGAKLQRVQFWGTELVDAQFQGADLMGAQFQGVYLMGAHLQGVCLMGAQLQGATLRHAQFQGADLMGAQFQGADLTGAKFQGVSCEGGIFSSFEGRINSRIGKDSDFSTVAFVGGLNNKEIVDIVSNVRPYCNETSVQDLEQRLKKHVDQEVSHELPEGAREGSYTEDEANSWIEEYNKAFG